ncbi:MAG: hypothetical protein RIS38_1232 [Verrucomicrobiota bacterium]|jgi:hypothetical protein
MSSFLKHLSMGVLALLPAFSLAALQPGKVQVGKTTGTVTLSDAKDTRLPLASGVVFQDGARVETGVNSTAELIFSNGSTLILTPGTFVEVRTFRQVASADIVEPYRQLEKDPSPSITEVEVARGKVIGEVRKLNALSAYSVKTPTGLVRIRGTVFSVEYRVDAKGIGTNVVSCVRGSVESTVYSSNVGAVSVDPGMQSTASVPTAALLASIARGPAEGAPAAAAALAPVKVMVFPIPAEDLSELSDTLAAVSSLPAEVAATIKSMAQTAPSRATIFPNGATEPAAALARVVGDRDEDKGKVAQSKAGAPGAPVSSSNGGGGTSMDDNLRRLSDNVNRSVEQKQLNPTPTGI